MTDVVAPAPPAARERTLLAGVPDRIVQVSVALALAAGITVSLGQFRPWTTLPLAALLVAATWRPFRPRVTAAERLGARWALVGAGV